MRCPRCKDTNLVEKKIKGKNTFIDQCPKCKGIWFDKKELDNALNVPAKGVKVSSNAQKQDDRCPRCDKSLYAFYYPRTWVRIDMCEVCEGIWLDNNEFKEIRSVKQRLQNLEMQTCPKCGHSQPESEECVKCGIIFSKYTKRQSEKKIERSHPSEIKGGLLRFIDEAIEYLTTYDGVGDYADYADYDDYDS